MAENGILDYQGMNQAIYRGATSNIVVDTQSMSIEIGAGNSSHTSNLHIECDHDANVASIQLNSNVVTEFSRSKKLIKYPRVALTANSSGGYVASASSVYNSGHANQEWEAFDNVIDPDGSGADSWDSLSNAFGNSGTPRTPTGNAATFDSEAGEWLNIRLPEKIVLYEYEHITRANRTHEGPHTGFLYGSNDGFTTYDKIHTFSGITLTARASYLHTVNATKAYNEYRLHVTRVQGSPYLNISNFKLFGIPEYDPEAYGTDVTVKSYPNVPNTDWLEVYYDAKGLPNGAVTNPMSGLGGTTINGTATNVTVSDGAFVFDGTSDIRSTVSTFTGDQPHTMSVWVNISTSHTLGDGYICVLAPSTGENLNQVSTIRYQNDGFNLQSWGNDIQMYNIGVEKGRWYHLVAVYDGGGVTTSSKRLYIDTVRNTRISGNTTTGDEIDFANTTLSLGSRVDGTSSHLTGSIANFRLFNRALSADEIYQLYAYQKEDFGHSTNNMTLKAGRLGIGTSEPRAALDVRGDIIGGCPVYFQARLTSEFTAGLYNNSINGAVIPWDQLYENTGCYNTTTGLFTAPMTAVYKFGYGMRPASSSTTYWTYIQKNGVAAKSANDHPGRIYSHTDLDTQSATFIMDLRMGDTVGILLASSGSPMPKVSNSYGYFHGHYFGESRGQHDFWD